MFSKPGVAAFEMAIVNKTVSKKKNTLMKVLNVVVQSLSPVRFFVTPWTAAGASLVAQIVKTLPGIQETQV